MQRKEIPTIERFYSAEVKKKAIEVFYTEGNTDYFLLILANPECQDQGIVLKACLLHGEK